jgi:hypothetical protein
MPGKGWRGGKPPSPQGTLTDDQGTPLVEPAKPKADTRPNLNKRKAPPAKVKLEDIRATVEAANAIMASLLPANYQPLALRGPMKSVEMPTEADDEIGMLSAGLDKAQEQIPFIRTMFGVAQTAGAGLGLLGIAMALLMPRLGALRLLPSFLQKQYDAAAELAKQQADARGDWTGAPPMGAQNGYAGQDARSAGSALTH